MGSTYGSTPIAGRREYGKVTANAGTAYLLLVEPMSLNWWTYIEFAQFTTTGTAHTATVMRPLSTRLNNGNSGSQSACSCFLTAAAAASQAVIAINQDPGVYTAYTFNNNATPRTANNVIAANDNVAYQYPDGTWEINTVASVSSLNITLTNSLATGGLVAGAPVWFFGATGDTNPYDGKVHPAFNLYSPSNPTILNFGSEGFPWMGTFSAGQPLLISVNNASNASVLERLTAGYSDRGSPYNWSA